MAPWPLSIMSLVFYLYLKQSLVIQTSNSWNGIPVSAVLSISSGLEGYMLPYVWHLRYHLGILDISFERGGTQLHRMRIYPMNSRNHSLSPICSFSFLVPQHTCHASPLWSKLHPPIKSISYRSTGVFYVLSPLLPLKPHSCALFMHHLGVAHEMHDGIPQPDHTSYSSIIRSCTATHHFLDAISVFHLMHRESKVRPDGFALAAVVKSSVALSDAELGKALHAFAFKGGYTADMAVMKALMDMYGRLDSLHDSYRLCGEMGRRDSVTWNVLLAVFAHAQLHTEVMELFHLMHVCGDKDVKPTAITLSILLPVCAKLRNLKAGRSIHGFAIKTGLESETLAGNALVSMYAKCGSLLDDAIVVFDLITRKDVVSVNSMIAGYVENGFLEEAFELFRDVVPMGLLPNYVTVAGVLPICAFVEHGWCYGKEIHCYTLRVALEKDLSVCNALLTYYMRVGDMKSSDTMFRIMPVRDLVTWNTVIAGYAMNGWRLRALELYHELLSTGMMPDAITLISVLPVCAELGNVQEGRKIHNYVLRHPTIHREISVGNALVTFYGKCGELDDALWCFLDLPRRDLISWNSMLTAYADNGSWEKLIDLFNQMNFAGIQADSVTILSVLRAFTVLGTEKVREIHGYSFRSGFVNKLDVGNAILDTYAKCGSIENAFKTFISLNGKNVITGNTMISVYLRHGTQEDAEVIFSQMVDKDLTTWNLMIQVYAQNGCMDRAFDLFRYFQFRGVRADIVSIVSILAACTRLASARLVRQCHGYKIRAHLDDHHLEGALLDAYSKCGSIKDAYNLFQTISHKDLITFTVMVGGFAMHGMAEEAVEVFSEMLAIGVKPDHVILTTLLSACSHAGLVDDGWKLFKSIDEVHGMKPTMEHYACVVDLLARRGRLREAYDFVTEMPCKPNANVWGTLLGACKIHGEVEIGRVVADHLFDVEAGNIGNYVVMSNIYAADGKWDGVEQMRRLMKSMDLQKPAGCSWIEIENRRHVFVAGDLSHQKRPSIYKMSKSLDRQIKEPVVNED